MRILSINRFALISLVLLSITGVSARAGEDQTRETMKGSIVYLEISSYGYDQIRPWKNTDVQEKSGVGCATGPYQVITPAWNLTDAKLIKAKVSGQNEYIPATIKTIDYEMDRGESIMRVPRIAGTLQPNPKTSGKTDFPCSPSECMNLSVTKAARAV